MTNVLPSGTVEALDEMLRVIGASQRFGESMECLAECRLCRNSLLYLLDGAAGATGEFTRVMSTRISILPVVHERHGMAGHPDHAVPQIRVADG